MVLHLLNQYSRGEIKREYCVNMIFTLLRPFRDLTERFARIVECPPPPQTKYGSVSHDPYINTAMEFGIWPGSLEQFLWKCRRAIYKQCTLEDAIVDLEHIKNTSGPFWLLWELYEPVLNSSWFMQMLFDGCIGMEVVPRHLVLPDRPSEADRDRSRVTPTSMVDSDLVCCYQTDCRQDNRPLGDRKHGSYGLLNRKVCHVNCSGRTVRDWCVLNDRWAASASGSEAQFHASQKNQYEERLFEMEDERVQFDVRICRMRSLLSKLERSHQSITEGGEIPFNRESFPRGFLSDTDILTLRELYDQRLDNMLARMAEEPVALFENVIRRLRERLEVINEVRKSREGAYHDVNKRNYQRSLEVVKVEQQPQQSTSSSSQATPGISIVPPAREVSLEFCSEAVLQTMEMIDAVTRAQTHKEDATDALANFIAVILLLKEKQPLKRNIQFTVYPSLSSHPQEGEQKWILSKKIVHAIQIFHMLHRTVYGLSDSSQPSGSGLRYAVALGHVPEAVLHRDFAKKAIEETLPAYITSGNNRQELESLFESCDDLPLQNVEMFKRAMLQFLKISQGIAAKGSRSQILIEAVRCDDQAAYHAITLEKISGRVHYIGNTIQSNDGTKVRLSLEVSLPRAFETRRRMRIITNNEKLSPSLVTEQMIAEEQRKIVTATQKMTKGGSRKAVHDRPGERSLEFRLGEGGIEFRGPGSNIISFAD